MDDFIIIKSKEDIEDLFLYIKRYLKIKYKIKHAVDYKADVLNKIYIKKESFNKAMEAFADFIIRNYVFFFVEDYIDDGYYGEISPYELLVSAISDYKSGMIIKKIARDMEEFSTKFNEINLSGYLMFTFRKYEELISQIIGEALDVYNAEEEYKRIVALLSDYVDECNSKIDTIHIIKQPDESYMYYDYSLNNLNGLFKENIEKEFYNQKYTTEDEMLCVLLNLNPKRINLHLKEQKINLNYLFTLEAIFGERIKICSNCCKVCKS